MCRKKLQQHIIGLLSLAASYNNSMYCNTVVHPIVYDVSIYLAVKAIFAGQAPCSVHHGFSCGGRADFDSGHCTPFNQILPSGS